MSALRLRLVIFVVMMTVLMPLGVVVALSSVTVGSIRYLITVEEPITCIPSCIRGGSIQFNPNLAPGEEQREEIQVFNSSEKNLDIMFIYHLEPEGDGVTVEGPSTFLVPGRGDTTQVVFFRADARVEAQDYAFTIQVERGEY